ncbi:MAG: flavodoxin family protein [Acidimicrobiia bacterium]
MRAVVIYESLTGNTKKVAETIGDELRAAGAEVSVCPITAIDYQALSKAELVAVGSWTDGIFVFGQRPGRAGRMQSLLPAMNGKKAVVFATFALNPGKVLDKLTTLVSNRGAEVLGGMAIRRDDLQEGARDLAGRLLGVANA